MSKLKLDNPFWRPEQALPAATNQDYTPAAVPILDRTNSLLFWARDWTGIDENTNGIPDWWEWMFFGDLSQPADGDFDGDGVSNLSEYVNGTDPNKIAFVAQFAADHVAHTSVTGLVQVLRGVPFYMAALLDNEGTNFSSASWLPYSSNFALALPDSDGQHLVWIGLKGLAPNSHQTWSMRRITLDRQPPIIVITDPTPGSTRPMIQVRGYSPEPLASVSYDLTNSAGLLSNQQTLVLDQFFDTNVWDFTTNIFQAFDVPLTNGENIITIHATDLAGNVTSTNFTYTMDSGTNAPVVSLQFPQDGMKLCGDSFTISGVMNDPTASITASLSDTNGVTNSYPGIVERDGKFWIEELPLTTGATWIVLLAVDAWGNTASTNFSVTRTDLALTISDIDESTLFQRFITVRGSVDGGDYVVRVNGILATNESGAWTANAVPVSPGGTASFLVAAYPSGQDLQPGAASHLQANVDKPMRWYVESDIQAASGGWESSWVTLDGVGNQVCWGHGTESWEKGQSWNDGNGGVGGHRVVSASQGGCYDTTHSSQSSCDELDTWPPTDWPALNNGVASFNGDCGPGADTLAAPPVIGMEHCAVTDPKNISWDFWNGEVWDIGTRTETYTRGAQTRLKLFTGGKSVSGRQSLFAVTGWANEILDPRAQPPWTPDTPMQQIPWPEVTVGDLGAFGNDGYLYKALPDGTQVDITPKASRQFYTFDLRPTKHIARVTANDVVLSDEGVAPNAVFSIGQKVVMDVLIENSPPMIQSGHWAFSGDYRNANRYYGYGPEGYYIRGCYPMNSWYDGPRPAGETGTPCPTYLNLAALLGSTRSGAWWIDRGIKEVICNLTLNFPNGQSVSLGPRGSLSIRRPTISISGVRQRFFTGALLIGVYLGDSANGVGGMVYDVDFTSDFPGSGAITQLIKPDYSWPGPTYSDFRLDGSELYSVRDIIPGTGSLFVGFDDFPSNPLGSRLKASFQDYVRFRPSGEDNIYVTLGIVSWNIDGEVSACLSDTCPDGYKWTVASTPDPTGPVDSTQFPYWSRSWRDEWH